MFGSTIIDVAIGVVLAFLAVSLAASAVTEAISSWLKLREATLLDGIKALVNDPKFTGIALSLYNHALINPFVSGTATKVTELTHKPAYIQSQQFAKALLGVLGAKNNAAAGAQNNAADATAALINSIQDPQLKSTLLSLWDAADKDVEIFKKNVAVWFDNSMDRLSGWYKRRTQWISFLVALAIAGLFNVDVIHEAARIWAHPALVAKIESGDLGKQADALKSCNTPTPPVDPTTRDQCQSFALLEEMETANLIGWPLQNAGSAWSWAVAVASWIVVAGANLFGASFWFDLLQRLTQLRGTGLVPKKATDNQTPKPDIAT